MDPVSLAALGLGALGVYLLSKGSPSGAVPINTKSQPKFTPQQQDQFTEMRGSTRFFRKDVAKALMTFVSTQSLLPVTGVPTASAAVFKLVPMTPGGVSAASAIAIANANGKTTLGSMSLVLVGQGGDKLLAFCDPGSATTLAGPASQFAVLNESAASASIPAGIPSVSLPGLPSTPQASAPFDLGLPSDIVKEVNAALSDPNADPDGLDKMSQELAAAGFPVAAKALADRASAIRLKSRIADAKIGTPYKIRATSGGLAADLPSFLAKYYTGDGNRWREIAPVNGKIGMIVKNGNLDPWKAGLNILLPLSWNVDTKPIPPPLGVPSKK